MDNIELKLKNLGLNKLENFDFKSFDIPSFKTFDSLVQKTIIKPVSDGCWLIMVKSLVSKKEEKNETYFRYTKLKWTCSWYNS